MEDYITFQSFLFFVVAQRYIHYLEVGTTLSLEPELSVVDQPVSSIRWKHGTSLVLDWAPGNQLYYGTFRGRTTLDPQTLRLDINSSTIADSGRFILETNKGTFGTHEVKVISKCLCVCMRCACNFMCLCVSVGVSQKKVIPMLQIQ